MRNMWIVTMVALVLGAAAAQGMGHAHGSGQQHQGPGEAGTMPGGAMPGGEAMGMEMMDHRIAFDDEAGFLQHMVLHHQEAVESAERLLEVGERAELLDLASGIIDAQRSEIAAMESWLNAWYPGVDPEIAYEPMMADFTGMTPEEAERSFIEGMIMHHMMAIRDARHMLMEGLAEHAEVEALAHAIVTDQMREIEQLQAWLRDWFDAPARMGTGMGMMGPDAMGPMAGPHTMLERFMRMMHGERAAARFDEAGVEALARAFLSGRGVEAEIDRIEPPRNVYRVTYRDGDAEGVVLVDADSGVVTMETPAE